jgi:uracil-DNA glycosylase
MSLNLDPRQRAMLEAMGVRLWQPLPPGEPMVSQKKVATQNSQSLTAPSPVRPPAPSATAVPDSLVPSPLAAVDRAAVAAMDWATLEQTVATCQACGLCKGRKNTVFGTGDRQARWLVVGEAPGEHEDRQGEPFVGISGQLLDNMLKAVGLSRTGAGKQGVFIANVLKCHPPANRNPQPGEVVQCAPYLQRQVALLKPDIILTLGRFAAQSLLQDTLPEVATLPLGKLRGQVHQYQGVPVVVSYHPAYLLRAPQDKAKAWADLCLAMDVLREQPSKTR